MNKHNIEHISPETLFRFSPEIGFSDNADYAIVGDGQYVVDLLAYIKASGFKEPSSIYVQKHNESLPKNLQKQEADLASACHDFIIPGTNGFQAPMLERIRPLLNSQTRICDVLLQKDHGNHPHYFFQPAPDKPFLLLITIHAVEILSHYLKAFCETLAADDIGLVVRHPMQTLDDTLITQAKSILVWNGSTELFAPVLAQCRALGRNITFAECGFFPQKGYFYFDKVGVNLKSQLNDDDLSWLTEADYAHLQATKDSFFEGIDAYSPGYDYIFVPLQVPNDSNVLNHSSFQQGMQAFIDTVITDFPNHNILFKAHPKDRLATEYDYRSGESIDLDSRSLILGAKEVVGINSSVLLEAALAYKPVFTYGETLLKDDPTQHQKVLCAMLARQYDVARPEFSPHTLDRFSYLTEDGLLQ